jgi:hypothetical protein
MKEEEFKKEIKRKNQLLLDLQKEMDTYQQQLEKKEELVKKKDKEIEIRESAIEMLKEYLTHLNQELNESEERNKELILKKINKK